MPSGGRALLGSRTLGRGSIVRRGPCYGFAGAAANSTIVLNYFSARAQLRPKVRRTLLRSVSPDEAIIKLQGAVLARLSGRWAGWFDWVNAGSLL